MKEQGLFFEESDISRQSDESIQARDFFAFLVRMG